MVSSMLLQAMAAAAVLTACSASDGSAPAQDGAGGLAYLPFATSASVREPRIGQLGGAARAVATIGDLAFLAVGPKVVAYDIARPTEPRRLGESEMLPQPIDLLYSDGDDLYALLRHDGLLYRIDPGNGMRLRVASTYSSAKKVASGSSISSVAVGSDIGFVCEWDRISAVELGSDGAMPVVGGIAATRYVGCTMVGDDLLLAWGGADGGHLHVFDATEPHAPPRIGRYYTTFEPEKSLKGIVVRGSTALLLFSGRTGPALETVDLSDPTAPRRLQRLDLSDYIDYATAAELVGDTIAVAAGRTVLHADGSDLARIEVLGTGSVPISIADMAPASGAVVAAAEGLIVLDATTTTSSLGVLAQKRLLSETRGLAVDGDSVVAAERLANDGGSDRLVAVSHTPGGLAATEAVALPGMWYMRDVVALPDTFIVSANDRIAAVRWRSGEPPEVSHMVGAETYDSAIAASSSGRQFFLTRGRRDGLQIVTDLEVLAVGTDGLIERLGDVTHRVRAPSSGEPQCGAFAVDVAADDNERAYVVHGVEQVDGAKSCHAYDFDLSVYDVRDVRLPLRLAEQRLCSISDGCTVTALAVEGGVMVTIGRVGRSPGLLTWDVAQPTAVRRLGSLELVGASYGPRDVEIHEGRAYIADYSGFVHEVDISDPTHPVVLATVPLPGGPTDIAVAGGAVWLSVGPAGVVWLPLPLGE